jgi:hypothetical protein
MPLTNGSSNRAISQNIRTEKHVHPDMPIKQAVAIALDVARRGKKHDLAWGGAAPKVATGPLIGATTGRSDKIVTKVPDGSHVLPADTLAAMGDGNSVAGFHLAMELFPHSAAHYKAVMSRGHKFGAAKHGGQTAFVDVNLSDGEFVVLPHDVAAVGDGVPKKGHDVLNKFTLHVRENYRKKLDNLPGPVE